MFGAEKPRTIACSVCKKTAKEPFFGVGFPNFLRLMDITDDKTRMNPLICPECKSKLLDWLNGLAEIIKKK